MNKWCITIRFRQRHIDVFLSCGISPKVNGPTWKHSHQIWSKTFKQTRNALIDKNEPKIEIKIREIILLQNFVTKSYFKHWNTFILGGGLVGTVDVEQGLEIDIIEGDTEALEWAFATGTVICKAPRRSKTAISGGSVTFLMAVPEKVEISNIIFCDQIFGGFCK